MRARGLLSLLVLATVAAASESQRVPAYFLAGTVPGTLRYQVVIEAAGGGEISGQLGTLTNLEVLAGPVLTRQVSWRGGEPIGTTALTWVVRARRPGAITVGPTTVRIDDRQAVSNEVHATAFVAAGAPAMGLHREMEVELSKPRLMVGEPLVVHFSVDSLLGVNAAGWEVQVAFPESWSARLPAADTPQALVGADGLPRVPLGGWLVIPVQPGRLEIPPAVARAVSEPGAPESASFPVSTATSRAVRVDVAPLPPAPAPFFGAVGTLTFTRRLVAGDLATVELEVTGVGNLPLLDPPPLPLPDGVRAFAAEESHEWHPSASGLAGWRRWRTPLNAARPGRYQLPAVRFCTFQPGSGYTIQALPPVAFIVSPSAAPPPAIAAPPPGAGPPGPLPLLLLAAAAFAAGAICVAALAAWRSHRRGGARPRGPAGEPEGELRSLQLAVEGWARTRFSATVAEGAARLAAAGCPVAEANEAVAIVQSCERLRFAPSLQDPADALANLRVRTARLIGSLPAR